MEDARLEEAIRRCKSVMESLPAAKREELAALLEQTRRRHEEIKQCHDDTMDALSDWRIVQKYLLFDREARRREG